MRRGSGTPRLLAGCLAALCIGAFPGVAGAAEPVGDPPAAMYEPGTVDLIRLTLPPASQAELEAHPEDEYVEGSFSIAETGGTPGTIGEFSKPAMVGIRLKGKYGSYRTLAQKAGFKVKFNFENEAGEKGKKYLGLKKMTLNNMVQDPSFIHEVLAYRAFRSTGVPSPRAGYAYLEVNGEDFGLHLNIETPDDVSLEKRVGPFQHLYEGAYGSDVNPGGAGTFEVDEGDEEDVSDLEALIAAVNGSDPADFSTRVAPFVDLKEMTRMWAVERYLGHWDGYMTSNNYYLLSDPAGSFQMLPWGTDQTWGTQSPFDEGGGTLFVKCTADASCLRMYRRSLREAAFAIDVASFDSFATQTAALLLPWEELEQGSQNTRHEYDLSSIAAAVQSTRDFIANRPGQLAAWEEGQPPEAPAGDIAVELAPGTIVADGASTTVATATVTDADGEPVPGDEVDFESSDPAAQVGAPVAHPNGTYTAQITSSTVLGPSTITATDDSVDPALAANATLTQTRGPAAEIAIELQPGSIAADGSATTTATVTIADAQGHPAPGDAVTVTSSDGAEVLGAVSDHGDGTYSARITSSTLVGTSTITVTDTSVSPALEASTNLTQRAVPPRQTADVRPPVMESSYLTPPAAKITRQPAKRTRERRPAFGFAMITASGPGAFFECKLDAGPYRPCTSPHRLSRLALGPHRFKVRPVGGDGRIGPVASSRFVVLAGPAR